MTIAIDVSKLQHDAVIELFVLDATALGGSVSADRGNPFGGGQPAAGGDREGGDGVDEAGDGPGGLPGQADVEAGPELEGGEQDQRGSFADDDGCRG